MNKYWAKLLSDFFIPITAPYVKFQGNVVRYLAGLSHARPYVLGEE